MYGFRFLVWVSFCEIYNEYIYDLLEPIPKKKNARRPTLILRDDKNGAPYVRGKHFIYLLPMNPAVDLWSNIIAMELPSSHIPSLLEPFWI